ncbi:MAG: YchF/TatD family DNA exonuclease [Thermodesulfovibrionales bacterium]|nr:YchF/TatD family DNA exonuclease [Thermodesulfovibrionales bacterium]
MPDEELSLIDTHCHLEMGQFDPDRGEVIKRAKDAGLEAVITIASDLQSNPLAIKLAEEHDFVYCSAGLHPHDAKDFNEDVFNRLSEWASHKKAVAVGETGLDYHYMHSPKEKQQEVFRRQAALAVRKGLPVIVHSREAEADTMAILKESGLTKGVMHCFSGGMKAAEEAMSMGFYISFAGPVTFKNAKGLKEIALEIPDDYLLIETDAPYLTPEPLRGKRNEPSYVMHIAGELARLRGVSARDIARITTLNARRLFGIGEMPEEGEIAYGIRDSLYLNITNRCTNRCSFCISLHSDYVKGHRLRLAEEPSVRKLKAAIGDPKRYREVVFCGYGEPLLRLDAVKETAAWIKKTGGRVRINTNGHGNLIHKRNILPELKGIVDAISVSLDAHDEETYKRLCRPVFDRAFDAVVEFIKDAKQYIPDVEASVVEGEGVDIGKCREITEKLGVKLRIRKLDIVG